MAIIVIGGGQAAGQFVASLRQEGYEDRLVLVSDEPWFPYQRPPLSKHYLAGKQGLERLFVRKEQFYADHGVEVLLGRRATSLDVEARRLVLDDGRELSWRQLVLALGSRVRRLSIPGAELGNVFYLRGIHDADCIRTALARSRHLAVIGGGYIGLEVAAVARQAGITVTLLEVEDRILKRVTTPQTAAFYTRVHEEHGVRILTGTRLLALHGHDGMVRTIECADGTSLEVDMVVIGVGVAPNVEPAASAGIPCDNGILVDESCRTSVSGIWAIGDCTNHPCILTGTRIRLESVPNAMDQARVAAANIMGKTRIHDAVPWFWSDQYDLKLQMAGFSTQTDTQVLRGDEESRRFVRCYLQGSVLVAVDAVNNPGEFLLCKRLIAARATPDPVRLADPAIELGKA